MKSLFQFIHYYIGVPCAVVITVKGFEESYYGIIQGFDIISNEVLVEAGENSEWVELLFVKPILHRLSDMTNEIAIAGGWHHGSKHFKEYLEHRNGAIFPEDTDFLLKNGFDLFELIEAGLANDAEVLTF